MTNITAQQLRQAADIKDKIASLENQLKAIIGGSDTPVTAAAPKKGGMSAAGRARIAAAQKARWAKTKVEKPAATPAPKTQPKKGGMTAAAKAALSAKMKKIWAARKAAKK
jgi:hypothetical protein